MFVLYFVYAILKKAWERLNIFGRIVLFPCFCVFSIPFVALGIVFYLPMSIIIEIGILIFSNESWESKMADIGIFFEYDKSYYED